MRIAAWVFAVVLAVSCSTSQQSAVRQTTLTAAPTTAVAFQTTSTASPTAVTAASSSSTPTTEPGLYDSPTNLDYLIDMARAATVGLECEGASGSGWSLDATGGSATFIVTNHHVIEDCRHRGAKQ